jgi:3-deoxy-D-manno-octulosonic-acid transferase
MLVFYSLALTLVVVAGAPYWLFRMATSGKYREGLGERLGLVPKRLVPKRLLTPDAQPTIWVHAVSLGEVVAATRLIEELSARAPGSKVVISTTTRTGQKLARERFGADRVFYFPLDFAFAVRAYLHALQPRMLVLLESEFWPRLLVECRHAQIPVAVVNARVSDRSWPRYLRLRLLWKRLLNGLSLVLAQSPLDAERLTAIGASNVRVGGNFKYDVRVAETAPLTEALRKHLPAGVKVVVCGSTLAGEEEMLLDLMPPDVVTILAPRHPERFNAVAELLRKRNARFVQRSKWIHAPHRLEPGTVFLLDSIGELASVYSLADVAFLGGSLVAWGGHNPLEPAQFGVPVMMGPNYANFRGIVEELRAHQAIAIAEAAEMRAALGHLLADEAATKAMGERAREVFLSEAGATTRAVDALLNVLGAPQ